ncbi:hypothetical protein D11S_2309 (plasmid) [Aggregatibacter actinomycetemcomitans D11S-1]|nr:hypothetical protein D11S_2309 [Aggregatibacter actinomycetemcomitans D11S-1]
MKRYLMITLHFFVLLLKITYILGKFIISCFMDYFKKPMGLG